MRLFLVILSLCVLPLSAQQTSDLDRTLSDKIGATLKQSGAPSASIAVVKDGRLVFARAFGKASIDPDRPATPDTRYAVGSISKQFTTAAILLMQEQGKLSLEDPVSKYFPNVTRATEITIRQLLSHTRPPRRKPLSIVGPRNR
jgi:D-alanyl-D-alanine carboxypeptidase